MTSRTNGSMKRTKELNLVKQNIPNWVVIVGGALLSTFSIRLCCKLKQAFDFKRGRETHTRLKENGTSTPNKRHESCKLHSQMYSFIRDEGGCYQCLSGDDTIPLVKAASIPSKPFSHSNSLDYLSISESRSDICGKSEVIQKLCRQLKRRDDMIVEMQVQITDIQNSLIVQIGHTTHLHAQLDSSNQSLLHSEREIQILKKSISNHFSSEFCPLENPLQLSV